MSGAAGYEWPGLMLFSMLAVLPAALSLALLLRYLRNRTRQRLLRLVLASGLATAIYVVVILDAFYAEPNWPSLEQVNIPGGLAAPLSVLQLSDLHIEANPAPREDSRTHIAKRLMTRALFMGRGISSGFPNHPSVHNRHRRAFKAFLDDVRAQGGVGCLVCDSHEFKYSTRLTACLVLVTRARRNVSVKQDRAGRQLGSELQPVTRLV